MSPPSRPSRPPRLRAQVYICGLGGSDYVSGARLRAGGDCEHQGLVQANPARVKAAAASFAALTSVGAGGPTTSQVRGVGGLSVTLFVGVAAEAYQYSSDSHHTTSLL